LPSSPKRHLPSFVTILNLFAGFLSVIHSFSGDYAVAAWLIVIAGLMDVLDGKVARMVKSNSEFGIELDSLADISSFGFAPAVLVYTTFFSHWGLGGVLICFLPLAFGCIRLARFNAETTESDEKDSYFKGLPIPAAAITLTSFVLFERGSFVTFESHVVLIGLIGLVSVLMISKVRYDAMPKFSFRRKRDAVKIAGLVIVVPLLVFSPTRFLFPVMGLFIVSGLIRALVGLFRHGPPEGDINDVAIAE